MASIKKLFTLTAISAALVACGSGVVDPAVATADSSLTISAATLSSVKDIVSEAGATTFALGSAISFEDETAGGGATVSSDAPSISFSPSANAGEIADFSMTTSAGAVDGAVEAGSCRFKVRNSTNPRFVRNQYYKISSCLFKLNTTGKPVGAATDAALSLILNNVTLTSNKTVKITIVAGANNTATVQVNGKAVGSVPLPTGSL